MKAASRLIGIMSGIVGITVFTAMIAPALAPSDAVAAACATSITTCCTISSPGIYTLANVLGATGGTCIDITASNVTFQSPASPPTPDIVGPGLATATFGVHIEPSANKVFLKNLWLLGFGTAIRVDGPNASLLLIETEGNNKGIVVNGAHTYVLRATSLSDGQVGIQINATATDFVMDGGNAGEGSGVGIKLNGVSGAFLENTFALDNGKFGIWLQSASNNHLDGFDVEGNGVAGVYLGCNPAGPSGTACPSGVPSSSGNTIIGSVYGGKASVASSNNHYGIAVGLGSLHNHFLGIKGTGNLTDDALDENGNCGSNRWFSDAFSISSPPANTTPFCLN